MTWFYWPAIWLAIFFLIILWRLFYRSFPKIGVLDLAVIPTFVFAHLTWGAAFYRSDLLAVLVVWLLIGPIWSSIALWHRQRLAFFCHRYWQATGIIGIILLLVLCVLAVILKR